jgi:hypothetical protein
LAEPGQARPGHEDHGLAARRADRPAAGELSAIYYSPRHNAILSEAKDLAPLMQSGSNFRKFKLHEKPVAFMAIPIINFVILSKAKDLTLFTNIQKSFF